MCCCSTQGTCLASSHHPQGACSLQQGEEQPLLNSHRYPLEANGAMDVSLAYGMANAGAAWGGGCQPRTPMNPTLHGLVHAGVMWPLGEGIREQRVAGACLADIKRE